MRCERAGFFGRMPHGQQLPLGLLLRPAREQGIGLGEAIGNQEVVMVLEVGLVPLGCNQKFDRNGIGALMQQLKKSMLRIGAGLAPHNWTGGALQRIALFINAFAV